MNEQHQLLIEVKSQRYYYPIETSKFMKWQNIKECYFYLGNINEYLKAQLGASDVPIQGTSFLTHQLIKFLTLTFKWLNTPNLVET